MQDLTNESSTRSSGFIAGVRDLTNEKLGQAKSQFAYVSRRSEGKRADRRLAVASKTYAGMKKQISATQKPGLLT
jgi:hypothetical protein